MKTLNKVSLPRIFFTGSLQSDITVTLSPTASQHIVKVLRLSVGSAIILFNGQGGQYNATLTEIKGRQVIARIGEFQAVDVESPLYIHLGQVLARGQKMDFIIQKAVELGVTEITPLTSTRCGVQLTQDRLKKRHLHWQGVIISACEQCGRNTIPKLNTVTQLDEWVTAQGKREQINLVLTPQSTQTLAHIKHNHNRVSILIGPEGGLSDSEIESARQHHFTPIKLGPRILRTETAGLASIAVMQSLWGDFSTI